MPSEKSVNEKYQRKIYPFKIDNKYILYPQHRIIHTLNRVKAQDCRVSYAT